jgi:hypothetical protein
MHSGMAGLYQLLTAGLALIAHGSAGGPVIGLDWLPNVGRS